MNGQGVLEWLERYAAAWRSNRSDEIIACWDQDAFLFYKAEEEPVFFDQWSRLERYWRQNEGLHERVILRFSDPMVKTARPGLLVATVNMRCSTCLDATGNAGCNGPRLPHNTPRKSNK